MALTDEEHHRTPRIYQPIARSGGGVADLDRSRSSGTRSFTKGSRSSSAIRAARSCRPMTRCQANPIRHVLVRHEQGAAHMADGYARASGSVGVCIATSGPGATNLVTGIANAMMDSIPMVCITGQVSSNLIGSDGFQEVDFTGVTLPHHQAQHLGDAHRGHHAGASPGVLHRELRAPGPIGRRHHQGRATTQHRTPL